MALDHNYDASPETSKAASVWRFNRMQSSPSSSLSYTTSSVLHSVTAGYVAGISGVLIGHPMDSAKVWLQTKTNTTTATTTTTTAAASSALTVSSNKPNIGGALGRSALSSGASSSSTTTVANMSTLALVSQERGLNLKSIRALYSGVAGPLVTAGMLQSVNFAIYDSIRRVLHKHSHPDARSSDYLHGDSLTNVTMASMAAGSVLAIFTSPLLVIKTKQQIMEWRMSRAVQDTLKTKQLRSFYVGFGPHCATEILGRGVYFYTYERLKRNFRQEDDSSSVSLPQRMLSAAIAGIVCWTTIFPLDALRSRMYAQALSSQEQQQQQQSSWEMAKSMWRESNSIRPFYRGFGITVLRAGPVAAAVLPIYDTTLEWLSTEA